MDEREPAGGPRRGGEGCGSRKLLVLKASESTACGVRARQSGGQPLPPAGLLRTPVVGGSAPESVCGLRRGPGPGTCFPSVPSEGRGSCCPRWSPQEWWPARAGGGLSPAAAGLTSRGRGLHCEVPCPLLMIIAPQTRSPLARFLHTCIASPRSRPPECPAPQCPAPSTTAVRGSSSVPGVQSLHVLRCWREMIFQ